MPPNTKFPSYTFSPLAQSAFIKLSNSAGLMFRYFPSSYRLYDIRYAPTENQQAEILINQLVGNPLEHSPTGLLLRIRQRDLSHIMPLIGNGHTSEIYHVPLTTKSTTDDKTTLAENIVWHGAYKDILTYSCTLSLHPVEPAWYLTVEITNNSEKKLEFDLLLYQDIALAKKEFVRLNEAFASHYLDQKILSTDNIKLLRVRQNISQNNLHPGLIIGCSNDIAGYFTDGFQLLGTRFKSQSDLNNFQFPSFNKTRTPQSIRQYEFACPGIICNRTSLRKNEGGKVIFFNSYQSDTPVDLPSKKIKSIIKLTSYETINVKNTIKSSKNTVQKDNYFTSSIPFPATDLTLKQCRKFFSGTYRNIEQRDNQFLSFFYGDDSQHVVLREKELCVERPTGHIIRTGEAILPSENDEPVLSATLYAAGSFGSQITLGNTAFNKITSTNRNALFFFKSYGTRIFVKDEATLYLLNVPSAFEMGLNHARWIYASKLGTIEVLVWTASDSPILNLKIRSSKQFSFFISYNVTLGADDNETSGHIEYDTINGATILTPADDSMIANKYPHCRFYVFAKNKTKIAKIGDAALLNLSGGKGLPYLVIKSIICDELDIALTGTFDNKFQISKIINKYRRRSKDHSIASCYPLHSLPRLQSSSKKDETTRINDILPWFLQNGINHLSNPRGLEQTTAAAWGTRDVCQGPVELLIALRKYSIVREIILKVYAHQLYQSGDWPQWFMFDRYHNIQSADSHGDIVIWPLKAICDYIEASGDFGILETNVSYVNIDSRNYTSEKESLWQHIERQMKAFESACIDGTALLKFGHGDWEDTLQPADSALREKMISSWSVELLYQTLMRWCEVCRRSERFDLVEPTQSFAQRIRSDFFKYLIKDGVVTGLFLMDKPVRYLLHPRDKTTGVSYRLLPMTRGIISEIFSLEQARKHVQIINDNLTFPDGVRLTNVPVKYHGGATKYFQRAETSAFFGREVGMMYSHSHLRYVEAMAKMGEAERAWWGLSVINPVLMNLAVKRSNLRQANVYFTSSDIDFYTRYLAEDNFTQVKRNRVNFSSGWRFYSSGPGLYFRALINLCIGIRDYYDHIVFDPVIPPYLDKLTVTMNFDNYEIMVNIDPFNRKDLSLMPVISINGESFSQVQVIFNPYRNGGIGIKKNVFLNLLKTGMRNMIEIKSDKV
jgi:cellobiose phosphorylase